ncbi:MAG: methyl-accepting chemotaxis protein [Methylovulum sp.]|nr:methyl-accepting chemotaxis protein [Methylovulum sp.]
MKINMPVTDKEVLMKKGEILVSRTDLKGRITYVNDAFVAISGYTREELLGANHNLIRHPDMPPAAFADLWATLQQGKPWAAPVKNRTKSGDFYWVEANVIPVYKNEQLHEYFSARYAPKREQIEQAEILYKKLNANTAKLRPTGLAAAAKAVSETALSKKVALSLAAFLAPIGLLAYQLFLSQQYSLLAMAALSATVATMLIISLARGVTRAVETGIYALYCMIEGNLRNKFDLNRNDQLGDLLRGLHIMQVTMNSQLAESRQLAADALRINRALDNVQSGVMVANADFNIIYMNRSVENMFKKAEQDIRKQLPDFNADKLMGANIDFFHKNPAHQRGMLEKLTGPFRSELMIGGHNMIVVANPVIREDGERIGFVAEWLDRTAEIKIEQEISGIVDGAALGDFTQRINEQDKTGFFLALGQSINRLMATSSIGLNEVVRVLDALSRGDLTETITNDYSGTFGQLKDDSNTTVEKLKEMIGEIIVASDAIRTAAKEIASGNNDLSHRTEEQAASLEQTAASMEELTSTVQANTQNAKHASQLAVEASDIAAKGVDVVRQVVVTMDDINQSSQKIGDIISVIDDIAFQTNILALNAAVEAARAGDKGKGFAVVAVEVRSLAQRAAKAAGEIKVLIHDSVDKVQDGNKLVAHAGQTMEEIVSSIRNVTAIMSDISSASVEQTSGIQQVNQAIAQMDDVTQQNAALVEQAAAAAESMEEQTQHLSATVAGFKLDSRANSADRTVAPIRKETAIAKARLNQPAPVTASKPKWQAQPVAAGADEWEEF